MKIEFDAAKDATNVEKHGVSLGRANDFIALATVTRVRDGETRYQAFGLIDGVAHCLVFTIRGAIMRVVSLRRAHAKEMKRYVK